MDRLGPVGMDRLGPVWDLLGCLVGSCWGFVGLLVVVLLDEQPTAMQQPLVGSNAPQKTSKMEFVSVLVEFLMDYCWLDELGGGEVGHRKLKFVLLRIRIISRWLFPVG